MARSNLAIIHPASTSRIEQASLELEALRAQIKELNEQKEALSARLLKMVEREGEEDADGKLRYETDLHKYVVIAGKQRYVHEKELRKAMLTSGLTPKQQEKILGAKGVITVSDSKYVGMYKKDEDEVKVGGKHRG